MLRTMAMCLWFPAATAFSAYSDLVVFGDSLSDTGILFSKIGQPPSPPYYAGRASNGPLAVEYLASSLNAGLTNFAEGGATTGLTNIYDPGGSVGLVGMLSEVNNYQSTVSTADPTALYILWGGADDFANITGLGAGQNAATMAANNLAGEVSTLASLGAKNFLVPNLPDLALIPSVSSQGSAAMFLAHAITLDFNGKLANALADMRSQTNANIIAFDTFLAVNAVVANPSGFGFTNVTDSCLSVSLVPCANPDQYLFWDQNHPTTYAHQLLGDQFAATVVPLPAAIWLFGSGLLGLIGVARGRVKQTW
jgi:phospholipase/lecithinase/hemolysin